MTSIYQIKINDPTKVKKVGDTIKFSTTYDQFNKFHIKTITWRFGDGTTSNKITPKHVYTTPGRKEVICQINRIYTIKKNITIQALPDEDDESDDEPSLHTGTGSFRVINNSDSTNVPVVIFQKNQATVFTEDAVAWIYIPSLPQTGSHSFDFQNSLVISYFDNFGNIGTTYTATPGNKFIVADSPSGPVLLPFGSSSSVQTIELENTQSAGDITGILYRSGKKVTQEGGIGPSEIGSFQLRPTLWIGVASELTEGELMGSAVVSSINTEISLLGIQSADIIMTGGGVGPSATPFSFTLSNIVLIP